MAAWKLLSASAGRDVAYGFQTSPVIEPVGSVAEFNTQQCLSEYPRLKRNSVHDLWTKALLRGRIALQPSKFLKL